MRSAASNIWRFPSVPAEAAGARKSPCSSRPTSSGATTRTRSSSSRCPTVDGILSSPLEGEGVAKRRKGTAMLSPCVYPIRCGTPLFQIRCDLVDAGFGAGFVLVAARRAGNADGADGIFADHDRQSALRGNHIAEVDLPDGRVHLHGVGEI